MNTSKKMPQKPQFVDFKQLKQEVSIRQVIERYGLLDSLSERGDKISGCCPFCGSDNDTAFRVSQSKNCFNCFSCEAHGNMLDFVGLMESCTIRQAALQVADWFGVETEPPKRGGRAKAKLKANDRPKPSDKRPPRKASNEGRVAETPKEEPATGNSPLGFALELDPDHPWFEEIGLSPETVKEFGLGFCERGTMRDCIAFPVQNAEGEIIAYVGRVPTYESKEQGALWRYPDAKRFRPELEVFNLHRVELDGGDGNLLVVSDPLEVVQLWQDGARNVVCFLSGELPASTLRGLCALFD